MASVLNPVLFSHAGSAFCGERFIFEDRFMIAKETIDEVKHQMDIVDVVGDFVNLKKAGSSYKALSPFTTEKTPSFFVSPSKQIYKCFSTGKGGDAISFVMEHDGMNYLEAIRYLANRYGIEIKEDLQTDEQLQQQNERDSLFIVLHFAKEYFADLLKDNDEGRSIGLGYFKERGFDLPVIEKFELGYSLETWDAFTQTALKNGYNQDLLEKAGLIIKKDEGKVYDRFRGRVIFPIHNVSGKVIAFGARILKKEARQPKYINSPETEVYHKSDILYGIYQAKKAIRQDDNCYLVEGYTDVVSLHQSDIENVVASSGTSLTVEQIRLISRFTDNITVLYDGDPAGIKASLRGVDMILENGLNVRTVVFPEGEDPDSYSRKLGTTAFKQFLDEQTVDFITFKVSLFASEAAKDPIKKAESIKEIVSSIAKIPDPIKRSVYIRESANLMDMEETVLLSEMNKILIHQRRQKEKDRIRKESELPEDIQLQPLEEPDLLKQDTDHMVAIQERESIRLLLNYGSNRIEEEYRLHQYLLHELQDVEFSDPVYKRVLQIYKEQLAKGKVIDAEFLMHSDDQEIKDAVVDLVAERYQISENWLDKYEIFVPKEEDILHNVVFTNILRLKFRAVKRLLVQNLNKLKQAKEEAEMEKLVRIHNELKRSEMELARHLGIVVAG